MGSIAGAISLATLMARFIGLGYKTNKIQSSKIRMKYRRKDLAIDSLFIFLLLLILHYLGIQFVESLLGVFVSYL